MEDKVPPGNCVKGSNRQREMGAKISVHCLLLLAEELDKGVQAYLTNESVIHSAVTMACAEGVVKSYDGSLQSAVESTLH